ncbi:MAG: DUF4012 domain-containing protein [Acidimicrobiales bacterium]
MSRQVRIRRRSTLAVVVVVVVVLAALLAGIGYKQVHSLASQLSVAEGQVRTAEAAVLANHASLSETELTRAEVSLVKVNEELHNSRVLSLAGVVPVGAQNLTSLRGSVALALQLVDGARQVIQTAQPLVGSSGGVNLSVKPSGLPLATMGALRNTLAEAAAALPGASQVPSEHWLLSPVSKAQTLVYSVASRARGLLSGGSNALQALMGLTGANGPQRIFFAIANDAEMRGTGGMILSYAVLDANDGHLSFEGSGPIDDLALNAPAKVSAPPDYSGLFGPLRPTEQWRNANLDSDFTVVAPVLAGMYKAATGKSVTAVVQIDSVALADILAHTGPIQVPGVGTVGASNAVALTLNQQYLQYPGRGSRQDALSLLVSTLINRLVAGQVNLVSAARGVVKAVQGRHLLVWSPSRAEEASLSQLGATGSLPGPGVDFAQLTVQNFGANKLDYYLETSLALSGARPTDKIGQVTATVTLHNTAPASGTNQEVFGPYDPQLVKGQYVGFVSLHIPVGWYLKGASGPTVGPSPSVTAQDGVAVVSLYVRVPAGATRSVTLDLETPPPAPNASLSLVPTPRVLPTQVSVNLREGGRLLKANAALTKTTVLSQ